MHRIADGNVEYRMDWETVRGYSWALVMLAARQIAREALCPRAIRDLSPITADS